TEAAAGGGGVAMPTSDELHSLYRLYVLSLAYVQLNEEERKERNGRKGRKKKKIKIQNDVILGISPPRKRPRCYIRVQVFTFYSSGISPPFPMWDTGALQSTHHKAARPRTQLLALETNLFLGGLGFYDQHRDMRLDIDNMSYEELLALEEKIEFAIRFVFSSCLCQEEYGIGDEVGRLKCKHGYHMVCIEQWLQLKNWCPICKASAVSSRSSSSPPL
ncbi:putative E3 ubiquitin-protein ligase HIP1, partial [Camellia lanceoleosa]